MASKLFLALLLATQPEPVLCEDLAECNRLLNRAWADALVLRSALSICEVKQKMEHDLRTITSSLAYSNASLVCPPVPECSGPGWGQAMGLTAAGLGVGALLGGILAGGRVSVVSP
jgi:hypothetical protein